ncbi:coniferyl aldehyde dehydrogenase [Kordiimonas sp. SCSIO 12610]|uniref:coniferyl aldehyde dehydrogenase n=1 Tax=Kordiimonas sp. SCSIO 12610 TaxID=2829597 RepID=UPI00210B0F03|nr:coniferyl aldehyde dehydrogenase [Kordiimonas sp. SCSIO 12610]UTW56510.1 coniferyl aldehyde dehydrogenase [Kordiimonas sp. SCSIO 12610]
MTIEGGKFEADVRGELNQLLLAQKNAFLKDPMPSRKERIRRLDKIHNLLVDNRDAFAEAVNKDFSGRPKAETDLAEIMPLLDGIAYYRKRVGILMKPERRGVPITVMPAKVEVRYQPKGVIGIVVPWNFPIFLALSPVIGAIAAGNRVMMKGSEFAQNTSELLKDLLAKTFSPDEITMVTGGVDVASEFTRLPFDHMVFTGSTTVGRKVMQAAAENLTPVTLELGGKSPAIIHPDFPIAEAANRIAFGKGINAGQVCVSPDYILCPKEKVNEFTDAFIEATKKSYPTLRNNEDFTAIITERQKERLESYIDDALAKGADLLTVNPEDEDLSGTRKLPTTLVLGATEDMLVMREEIFGPILPVLPYDKLEDAIAYVNDRPRPLALYYFDWNTSRADEVLGQTHSGGACINDTMSHVMSDDIPFGGVGPSGIGHYHGEEGFKAFSHAKGVVRKGRINAAAFIGPPWDNMMFKGLMALQELRFRRRRIKD